MADRANQTIVGPGLFEPVQYFNGVAADTSEYLHPPIPTERLLVSRRPQQLSTREALEVQRLRKAGSIRFGGRRPEPSGPRWYRGTRFGIQPEELDSAGWGVVFAAGADPAVKEALLPLLEHRRAEAGERYREYEGPLAYRPGESAAELKGRMGVGPGPVDPAAMPYHLLLVGSPQEIPFHVQHELDAQHAVGRLDLGEPDAYARYAEKVVAAERGGAGGSAEACFFATAHPGDPATLASSRQLVGSLLRELSEGGSGPPLRHVVAEEATKAALHELLCGDRRPGLVFTATHGVELPRTDPCHLAHQGALLCHEWDGPPRGSRRPIPPEAYLSGDDVVGGRPGQPFLLFSYACYSAGAPAPCPAGRDGRDGGPASRAFSARLPQRLLADGGALAAVGHVDRTWGCSFLWESRAQPQTFASTLQSLLAGRRIGTSLDYFAQWRGELAGWVLGSRPEAAAGPPAEESRLSLAHRDARSFILLGDPAVRMATGGAVSARPGPEAVPAEALEAKVRTRPREEPERRLPLPAPELDEHLDFAERMIGEHDLDAGRAEELRRSCRAVRARRRDPSLYLAVVGEFSSGKSLLINHLVRDRLLGTSAVQATTSAATLIRSGEHPSMEVEWVGGGRSRVAFPAPARSPAVRDAVRRAVGRLTVHEPVARRTERVRVTFPFPQAIRDLVLVDTPGTNVEDERHLQVTEGVMSELCDAAVVVVPAPVPLSQSLARLVRHNLAGSLHRCVFVVTQIDRIPADERGELLETIEARLCRMLSVEEPRIEAVDLSGPPEAGLGALERRILDHVDRQRDAILVESAVRILVTLLEESRRELDRLASRYREEHRALEESRIDDLDSYLSRQRAVHRDGIDRAADAVSDRALEAAERKGHGVRRDVLRMIGAADRTEALREVASERAPAALDATAEELRREVSRRLAGLREECLLEIEGFRATFAEAYRRLADAAGVERDEPEGAVDVASRLDLDGKKTLSRLANSASSDEATENGLIGGGMCAGAIVGQVLIPVPGVGAAVGAIAGAIFGAGFTVSIDELRKRHREQAGEAVDRWRVRVRCRVTALVDGERSRMKKELDRVMKEHANRYGELVDRCLAADRERAGRLRELEERVRRDTAEIARRRELLEEMSKSLRQEETSEDRSTGARR